MKPTARDPGRIGLYDSDKQRPGRWYEDDYDDIDPLLGFLAGCTAIVLIVIVARLLW